MADDKEKTSLVRFSGKESDFRIWMIQFESGIHTLGLGDYVEQIKESHDPDRWDRTLVNHNNNKRFYHLLVCSLDKANIRKIDIKARNNGLLAWKFLLEYYSQPNDNLLLSLREKLISEKLTNDEDAMDYILRIEELVSQIKEVGGKVPNDELVAITLRGLPPSYKDFINYIRMKKVCHFDKLCTRLKTYCDGQKGNNSVNDKPDSAFVAQNQPSVSIEEEIKVLEKKLLELKGLQGQHQNTHISQRKPRTCFNCGKIGHFAKDCRSKKKLFHKKEQAQVIEYTSNEQDDLYSFHSGNSLLDKSSWVVDSGCTRHMTHNKRLLKNIRHETNQIFTALTEKQSTNMVGDVLLPIKDTLGTVHFLTLKNVVYVPNLNSNLLSVCQLLEEGHKIDFEAKVIHFGKWKVNFSINKRLPIMVTLATYHSGNNFELWHRRLGHPNDQTVKIIPKLVNGIFYKDGPNELSCEVCRTTKSKRLPFTPSSSRVEKPLDLIHSDLYGPIKTPSFNGEIWAIVFVDDFSRFTVTYPMKAKSEAESKLSKFIEQVGIPQKIRSDNGGEFLGQFSQVCSKHNIRREFSAPYTPEQNGRAERSWGILIKIARSLLAEASLPKQFWSLALLYATYLRNRLPTSSNPNNITPHEAFFGYKPNLSFLKIFGCRAYVHIEKANRKSKLDKNANIGMYVGIPKGVKGYLIYLFDSQKVVISRNVVFDEKVLGLPNDKLSPTIDIVLSKDISLNSSKPIENLSRNEPLILNDNDIDTEPEQEDEIIPQSQELRRSSRVRKPIQRLVNNAILKVENLPLSDPKSYKEAMNTLENEKWKIAIEEELKSMEDNHVWKIEPLPSEKNLVSTKWVFRKKQNSDGTIERYKARLVARGFTQIPGVDYFETFAPVVKNSTVKTLIAVAAAKEYNLGHIDVKTAYLNAIVNEEIWISIPEGFNQNKIQNGFGLKLQKSLYGLKQAGRNWNTMLKSWIVEYGLTQSKADPCLFVGIENGFLAIATYVDDLIIVSSHHQLKSDFIAKMKEKFTITDLGDLTWFLGVKVENNDKYISLSQHNYLDGILKNYDMNDSKPKPTPLCSAKQTNNEVIQENDFPLKNLIGNLSYLSIWSRPDITYATNFVSRHNDDNKREMWKHSKRILRYLNGCKDDKLVFTKGGDLKLVGYTDSDWGGDVNDRKSTTGYLFKIGNNIVSWRSKKQQTIALSSAEAEYYALSDCMQEGLYLQQLLADMGFPQKMTIIHCDNQACIDLSRNPVHHQRTKHIDIKHHYIRDHIEKHHFDLKYIHTSENPADLFTKSLNKVKFAKFKSMILGFQVMQDGHSTKPSIISSVAVLGCIHINSNNDNNLSKNHFNVGKSYPKQKRKIKRHNQLGNSLHPSKSCEKIVNSLGIPQICLPGGRKQPNPINPPYSYRSVQTRHSGKRDYSKSNPMRFKPLKNLVKELSSTEDKLCVPIMEKRSRVERCEIAEDAGRCDQQNEVGQKRTEEKEELKVLFVKGSVTGNTIHSPHFCSEQLQHNIENSVSVVRMRRDRYLTKTLTQ